MIPELFRPMLRWLFWNRRRPLLVLAALIAGIAIVLIAIPSWPAPLGILFPGNPAASIDSTSIAVISSSIGTAG